MKPLRDFGYFLLLLVGLWTISEGNAAPHPRPDYYAPDAQSTSDGNHHSAAANLFGHRPSNQQAFCVASEANHDFSPGGILRGKNNVAAEAGVYRSSGTTSYGDYKVNFLNARAEYGNGAMGRATISDASIDIGPGKFTTGVGFDTGIIANDGLEVKVLGVGGTSTVEVSTRMEFKVVLCSVLASSGAKLYSYSKFTFRMLETL